MTVKRITSRLWLMEKLLGVTVMNTAWSVPRSFSVLIFGTCPVFVNFTVSTNIIGHLVCQQYFSRPQKTCNLLRVSFLTRAIVSFMKFAVQEDHSIFTGTRLALDFIIHATSCALCTFMTPLRLEPTLESHDLMPNSMTNHGMGTSSTFILFRVHN